MNCIVLAVQLHTAICYKMCVCKSNHSFGLACFLTDVCGGAAAVKQQKSEAHIATLHTEAFIAVCMSHHSDSLAHILLNAVTLLPSVSTTAQQHAAMLREALN